MFESNSSVPPVQPKTLLIYQKDGKQREYNLDPSLTERERHIRAAAFIDGEGDIQIKKHGFLVHVGVTSTTLCIPKWLMDNYGGSISSRHRQEKDGYSRKFTHRWVVGSALAEQFLVQITPFLLLKQEQAFLALELRSLQGNHMKHLTSGEKYILWRPYYEQMKALHKG